MNEYRFEIDGLRTIAVFAVIIFHLNPSFLQGGYYGVDVFFVISGYLITSHLTKEIKNKTFSFHKFWLRRVKRLLPAILTVIFFILFLGPFLLFRPIFANSLNDIFPAIFSYFNFKAYFVYGDYWGQKADNSFFLHTWSLSLEEQFYLLYPILLFCIYRFNPSFLKSLIFITLLSTVLFAIYLPINKDRVFYLLPFRFWELSAGGIIALISTDRVTIKLKNIFSFVGVLLILLSFVIAERTLGYVVFLPIIGTVLTIAFCTRETFLGKILALNGFTHFGKLSYSLYLWHWPIITLFKNLYVQTAHINKFLIYIIIILITYFLSLISFKLIENKTRRNKYTPYGILLSILIITSFYLFYKSDYFSKHYVSLYNTQTYYNSYFNISPKEEIRNKNDLLYYNTVIPNKDIQYLNAYAEEGIVTKINNSYPKIMVLGDSHGTMWAKTIQEISNELSVSSSFYTANATWPFFNLRDLNDQQGNKTFSKDERIKYAKSIVNNIDKWDLKVMIIACRWEHLDNATNSKLDDLLNYLSKKGIKVILINQPPVINFFSNLNTSQYLSYLEIYPKEEFNYVKISDQDAIIEKNKYLDGLKGKFMNLEIFDVNSLLLYGDKLKISHGRDVIYLDEDHLSHEGTQLFKDKLLRLIVATLS